VKPCRMIGTGGGHIMLAAESEERRRFHRIAFHRPAALRAHGTSAVCELLDISLNGALLEVPRSFAGREGDVAALEVRLAPRGAATLMDGEIVHREPGRVGYRCESIDLESIQHLRRLVELNLGDDALVHRELAALVAERSS
jgi:hypothetical protein